MTTTILTEEILKQLGEGLRIVHDGPLAPKPGERLGVRLESLTGPLSVSDVFDVLAGNITNTFLPISVQVPVQVEVEWTVVLTPSETALQEGSDFESLPSAGNGSPITAPEVSFLFHPQVVEPQEGKIVPSPLPAEIRAQVTLKAQPANPGQTEVSEQINLQLPVLLPVIPLPTVLALFRHANFLPRDTNLRSRSNFIDTPDGFVLLVVPDNSPLKALTHLFDLLSTVAELGSLAGSLIPAHARLLLGLQKLATAIGGQPHIKFRAVKELSNLNAVVMIQRDLTHNDIEVEDEVSSLILIGPKDTKVSLFNGRDFDNGEGHLDVVTGEAGIVVIRDLHTAGKPVSETGGTIEIKKHSTKKDGFGQAISSLKLVARSTSGLLSGGILPVRLPRKDAKIPLTSSVKAGK